MRNSALVRVLKIMRTLDGRHIRPSLDGLASEHHVSTRTIRRDLEALAAAGVPVPKGYNPCCEAAADEALQGIHVGREGMVHDPHHVSR